MAMSSTHHARETTSSRQSFATSHIQADLRERKERLLQVIRSRRRAQLVQRSFAAYTPAAKQHEPIAHARGIANLVDR